MALHTNLSPVMIELPHKRRISIKGLRRGQILRGPPTPQTAGAAKRGNAAFRGNAGARQDDDATRGVVETTKSGDVGGWTTLLRGGHRDNDWMMMAIMRERKNA